MLCNSSKYNHQLIARVRAMWYVDIYGKLTDRDMRIKSLSLVPPLGDKHHEIVNTPLHKHNSGCAW